MKDMEFPEQRNTITLKGRKGLEVHIIYFDQNDLIDALQSGISALALDKRIFVTASRSPAGHIPSEWETNKNSGDGINKN